VATRAANLSSLVEGFLDLRATMLNLGSPLHLTSRIVDHRNTGGLGTWVDLNPQRLKDGMGVRFS
jgi:hypothetical protein